MKVHVIYCRMDEVEKRVNDFLRDVPRLDVDNIDVVGFPAVSENGADRVAVFIWLKVSRGGVRR